MGWPWRGLANTWYPTLRALQFAPDSVQPNLTPISSWIDLRNSASFMEAELISTNN